MPSARGDNRSALRHYLERVDRHTESAELILVSFEPTENTLTLIVREVVARDVLRELVERRVSLANEQRREEIDPMLELLLARGERAIREWIAEVVLFLRVELVHVDSGQPVTINAPRYTGSPTPTRNATAYSIPSLGARLVA